MRASAQGFHAKRVWLSMSLFLAALLQAVSAQAQSVPQSVSQRPLPLQTVLTFDGQVMNCQERADIGRVAYQMTSANGVIRSGNVEINLEFVTLKCDEHAGGIIGFRLAPFVGRIVNALGGFIEFSSLEMVGYTPDFKVVRSHAVSTTSSKHAITLV
ncbi:MAG: hypothetical protein RBT63_08565, partial [Bdellovibrionales bacterium]|nr:hypothetical protein [Bdellovibrionales bacterium]